MKKLIIALICTLFSCLFMGTSSGGFVNEPTLWNDPNWTGLNGTSICPFCYTTPFSLEDYLNPKPQAEPVVEPEKPLPIVIPEPLPYTKGDIASLLEKLPVKQLPSQQYPTTGSIAISSSFGKHVFYF